MKITVENWKEVDLKFGEKGLIPAIVQDLHSGAVLMQAYMNVESIEKTFATGKVTFYSRSREQLWTKGETSGNFLELDSLFADCDQDSLLVTAIPSGPTCHTGSTTCFGEMENLPFLPYLQKLIQDRKGSDPDTSYTASLFDKGIDKVAQKVGEEAVELVIEAKNEDREKFMGEAADLMYHYLVLLAAKDYDLRDVVKVLSERHR